MEYLGILVEQKKNGTQLFSPEKVLSCLHNPYNRLRHVRCDTPSIILSTCHKRSVDLYSFIESVKLHIRLRRNYFAHFPTIAIVDCSQ